MKKVVVVAPTYNEEENIANFLNSVLSQVKNLPEWDLSVVISDSHSSDKTADIVRAISSKNKHVNYLDVKNRGLGLGLAKGLDYAATKLSADVLVTMEADLSNNPEQLPQFLDKIKSVDLVVGSRYVPGGKIVNWSWWRKALSLSANYLLRLLALTSRVHEFTNLYRAFTTPVWLKIKPNLEVRSSWLFVPAFIFEAIDTDFKIVEQPIVYFDRFGGRSKMRTLSYTKNLLEYAIRYRLRKSASVFKFAVVGTIGFIVNTIILVAGVQLGLRPSVAASIGAELAILVGFTLNNFWTFKEDRLKSWREFPFKFVQYNVIALGSVVVQFLVLRLGEFVFTVPGIKKPMIDLPVIRLYSWYMFFYMWGVGIGMVWNYIMYRKVVWRKK